MYCLNIKSSLSVCCSYRTVYCISRYSAGFDSTGNSVLKHLYTVYLLLSESAEFYRRYMSDKTFRLTFFLERCIL